jgi:hypothetical protein
MVLSTVWCARKSAQARAQGLFGPVDSIGRRGQCLRIANRPYGVFFRPDSSFSRADRVSVVDLTTGTRYTQPVDTMAIVAEAKASSAAIEKAFPSFRAAQRQFAPISFRSDGDSIQVWLVSAGSIMGQDSATVGGERGYVYSPDGRTLAREVDASDRFRRIAVPDTGTVYIESREDDLPLMSELIVANRLHADGRDVQIVTSKYASHLTVPEPAVWLQIQKR